MEDMRGKIIYRDRKQQILSFENIRYGNITPTDIDCSLDYHGYIFAFIEIKLNDTAVKDGQRKHLENIVNGLSDGGREAIAIIASHDVENIEMDVDVANCIVREIYRDHKWEDCSSGFLILKQELDSFMESAEKRHKAREREWKLINTTAKYMKDVFSMLRNGG